MNKEQLSALLKEEVYILTKMLHKTFGIDQSLAKNKRDWGIPGLDMFIRSKINSR